MQERDNKSRLSSENDPVVEAVKNSALQCADCAFMLPGNTILCTAVPVRRLTICGATMPTKPIGPQNAVTAPVISALPRMALNRIAVGLAPERAAYSSPNRMMSSPL